MQIIEMVLNEESGKQGVHAVSVVNSPAIEADWVALKKHEIELKTIDLDKRILMGAALIPNKQILRADAENGEYYIYFSKETISKASQLFLKNSNQNNATYEHNANLSGMSVVESWIVEDENIDKSKLYNFSFPVGTWVIAMKVDNEEVWNDVKLGKIKGFSIEGFFESKEENLTKVLSEDEILNKVKEILESYE